MEGVEDKDGSAPMKPKTLADFASHVKNTLGLKPIDPNWELASDQPVIRRLDWTDLRAHYEAQMTAHEMALLAILFPTDAIQSQTPK